VEAEAIALGDARWEALTARADVYYRAPYTETAVAFDPGVPLLLRVASRRGEVILPVIERTLPPELAGGRDLVDWISPYGFSGPLAVHGSPDDLLEGLRAIARERRAVSAFVRCHPIEATHRALPASALPRGLLRTCAAIDLSLDEASLRARLRPSHRRAVRKAEASGIEVRWSTARDDLVAFAALYEETMDRVGAASYYRLPGDYFPRLAARLPGACGVLGAWADGSLAAALLLLRGPRLLHYHLGGSRREALPLRPNHLLFWEAIRWGRAQGLAWLNLGAGLGPDDDLLAFKLGFGGARLEWYKGCLVLDPDAYARLAAARGPRAPGDFFPAYRATRSDP
jgi:hypothetical protein